MKNDYLKYFKPSVLIGLVVFQTIGVITINTNLTISISIFTVVTFVLTTISTKLWNKKWIIWMFWVDDISGCYEGILRYKYIDDGEEKTGELKHVKIINQNGYRISITSFTFKTDGTPSSQSENIGVYVKKTTDERHFLLVYNYLNNGSTEQGFPPYWGTEIIKIMNVDGIKTLSGNYFTDRNPQTKGDFINMKWVNNDLNHKF
jgi:hypothetical protein